jgi:hypothetical protein
MIAIRRNRAVARGENDFDVRDHADDVAGFLRMVELRNEAIAVDLNVRSVQIDLVGLRVGGAVILGADHDRNDVPAASLLGALRQLLDLGFELLVVTSGDFEHRARCVVAVDCLGGGHQSEHGVSPSRDD